NATANDVAVAYLKNKYANWEKSVLEAVKYVRQSPQRLNKFKEYAEIEKCTSKHKRFEFLEKEHHHGQARKKSTLEKCCRPYSRFRFNVGNAKNQIEVRINDLSGIFGVSSTTSPILSLPIGSLTASWFSFAINSCFTENPYGLHL
ncbi:hypothetical protein Tco_1542984, partial [Tanacetum coccineum]